MKKRYLFFFFILIAVKIHAQWPTALSNDDTIRYVAGNSTAGDVHAISDGNGGVIIAWEDRRGSNYDVYAQHLNKNGKRTWINNGIIVTAAPANQQYIKMISDGQKGAIISWSSTVNSGYDTLRVQHIDSSGKRLWDTSGVIITDSLKNKDYDIGADGFGVDIAYATIKSFSINQTAVSLESVNSSGKLAFKTNALVSGTNTDCRDIRILIDNASVSQSYAYVCYHVGVSTVYVQRISINNTKKAGVVKFPNGGIKVDSVNTFNQPSYSITYGKYYGKAPVQSIGLVVTWANASSNTVYIQEVHPKGTLVYGTSGKVVCNYSSHPKYFPVVTNITSGGYMVGWCDGRFSGSWYLYAQHINPNGTRKLADSGVYVAHGINYAYPRICTDDAGGTYFGYQFNNVYGEHIDANGSFICSSTAQQINAPVHTAPGEDYTMIANLQQRSAIFVFHTSYGSIWAKQWLSNCNFGKGSISFAETILPVNEENVVAKQLMIASVSPNPAINKTTIHFYQSTNNVLITLTSVEGKVIYQQKIKNINAGDMMNIPLNNVAKGIYFLNMQSSKANCINKIIVE